VITDEQGRFSRLVPPDAENVSFRVLAPDHLSYHFTDLRAEGPPVQALRDGSAVIVIKRGVRVRGFVRDAAGKPVENALVMAGRYYSTTPGPDNEPIEDFTSPRTGKDGSFSVGGLPPGWGEFTITAAGFAPTVDQVEVKPEAPPVELKVEKGVVYSTRVVDADGKPIPGARVGIDEWVLKGVQRRCVTRVTQTDADGRFTLSDLPAQGKLSVSLAKRGFLMTDFTWEPQSGKADALTLYPPPVVRGRVVDAASGEPVPGVKAVPMWGEPPRMMSMNGDATGKPDGTFELKIENVIVTPDKTPPFAAKILAKGYYPVVTPLVRVGKASEPSTIKLEKGEPVTGTVADADGKPLERATVALIARDDGVAEIQGFKFNQSSQLPHPIATTDAGGRFELPPSKSDGRLLVLHEKGYLILPYPGLPNGGTLSVIPWARVEGIARKDGKPLHGAGVTLSPGNQGALFGGNIRFGFRAATHVDGRFVFENVPSANWRADVQGGNGPGVEVAPEPGKTQSIELGGPGTPGVG
jgi:protocatechuate 3,4-dioxygenase beta subunit